MDGVAAETVTPPIERSRHTTAKKAARAVGKAVLFVPRLLVTAALIPIRGTVALVSRYELVERTVDLLYNDARTAAVLPLVGYESGFGASGGLVAFQNDLFGSDERLSLSVRFGGRYIQGYNVHFGAPHLRNAPIWLDVRLRYESNPGRRFAGIGAPTEPGVFGADAPETFFSQDRALAVAGGGLVLGERRYWRPGMRVVLNSRNFDDPLPRAGVPAISTEYDTSTLEGFDEGIDTAELQVVTQYDARIHRGLWRRGLLVEAFVGGVAAPSPYLHWGAEVGWDLPLWLHTRVLSTRLAVEGVSGGVDSTPFTELPRLGGPDRLRGYPEGLFRGTQAALASVEYTYPIHKNLSGNLFADFGRVATSIDDFASTRGWRLGMGGGFLIGSEDGITLRLSAAGGDRLQLFVGTDLAHAFDGRSELL